MNQDCREKRAAFIDASVKVREMFSFAHPMEIISAVEKHCSAFYGSSLYDLGGSGALSLQLAWNTSIKLSWKVSRECRSYFLEHVLAPHCLPIMKSLLSRFHTFFLSLLSSPSKEVRIISRLAARDLRTSLGSNLRLLSEKSGMDPWTTSPSNMKLRLKHTCRIQVPENDKWRLPYLGKLLNARLWAHYSCNDEQEEILTQLIESLIKN